ncbi:MAG: thymidine phosphorylase [Gammaproteobacteria bacterium]|nr:thymidine phosphorylase [Gammaproteobacteria bacterium]|tara:strand:+ start:436 stop:1980 length:1545 start_codon:yes stop_codon:yes gene_type:complete
MIEARLPDAAVPRPSTLRARRMGIDTYQEPVVYMRADCAVCRSEGFESRSRVRLAGGGREIVATLNVVQGDVLGIGQAGLSESAWALLNAHADQVLEVSHAEPVESFRHVRAKLFGNALSDADIAAVVRDVADRRFSDVQLSAFLSAGVGERLSSGEIVALTRAMVAVGETLSWDREAVFDKHCVGGLPGNRTTPLVVAIVTACGLTMPKTSSRAITSPAGTADAMEMLAPVDLTLPQMRRVVEREGGCVVWGGAVDLSPADDVLIRVERELDVDSEAQLVASVLSKKISAGSTRVLIDVPVGPTAKVRDADAARRLAALLEATGAALGLQVDVLQTDGSQPVGRGIGPALEARDVLRVLRGAASAPTDLRDRAAALAGAMLERGAVCAGGRGMQHALDVLADGRAWHKFQAICEAQGGLRTPPVAPHQAPAVARHGGRLTAIDNRRLARLAKLAGAPQAPAAGVELLAHVGERVSAGAPLLMVHAETPGELEYAFEYLSRHPDMVAIAGEQGS